MNDAALQSAIARDRAARAGAMAPGLKLMAGARLFDAVSRRMLVSLQGQYPDWSVAEAEAEVRRRLKMVREHEDRDVFTPAGML